MTIERILVARIRSRAPISPLSRSRDWCGNGKHEIHRICCCLRHPSESRLPSDLFPTPLKLSIDDQNSAGGAGIRLWPVSRDAFPKQFLPLVRSTYQETLLRVSGPELFAPPIVITGEEFGFLAHRQAEDIGIEAMIIVELMRRDSRLAHGRARHSSTSQQRRNPTRSDRGADQNPCRRQNVVDVGGKRS